MAALPRDAQESIDEVLLRIGANPREQGTELLGQRAGIWRAYAPGNYRPDAAPMDAVRHVPGDESSIRQHLPQVELPSGRRVLVLSLEDLLLWRLREWVHWHIAGGFQQAAHLLIAEPLDAERLDQRAAQEGLALALAELRMLTGEIESGRVFQDWELAEIGEKIERESYSASDE